MICTAVGPLSKALNPTLLQGVCLLLSLMTCNDNNMWMLLTGDLNFEMRVKLEEHKAEVSALKKRLQWYAENQELLDKDTARLRAATAETQKLKEQVLYPDCTYMYPHLHGPYIPFHFHPQNPAITLT